jgi:hypothetical protein
MDDSFTYRTTVPLRRRIDPRAVKVAVGVALVALAIGNFARWVIASERESFQEAAARRSSNPTAVTEVASVGADPLSTDADAKEAARIALTAARATFAEHRSYLDAGPAQLTALQPGYSFVDGPSTMARIVSVATSKHVWAAAVRSSGGTCFWIRSDPSGSVSRGTRSDCTAAGALTAPDTGW